ncbi:hypothetical protein [Sphingobacterium hungaricum]|uniref:Uncharacterized protein n=1 Tax=Sphingobacterium hungaricum TaxID=2082723 RepID=A0A928UTN5_9SPHI|nr:hypothetical protein [Sphingobacterium hungaricum]MBE8712537.1 hypothetical protein [Sphingobacterium hungaricum]
MAAVTGIKSLELAIVAANGAMPVAGWIKVDDLEMGSVNITVPPLEKVRIRVEDKSGIRWVLPGETDPASLAGNSLNLSVDKANLLFKGLVTTGATEFKAPTQDEIYYLAARLTSNAFEGKQMVWEAPSLAMSAGFANALTKDGFLAFSFSGEATTPVDASGEAVSPWGYKFIDVVLPEG